MVRRAYRYDMTDPVLTAWIRTQPSSSGQTTHTVTYQQRYYTLLCCYVTHSPFNQRGVVINRGENRFQADRYKGNSVFLQALQPGVPEAAVAQKSVNQYNTALFFYYFFKSTLFGRCFCQRGHGFRLLKLRSFWYNGVRKPVFPIGLVDNKHLNRQLDFFPPCQGELIRCRPRRRACPVDPQEHQKL